MDIIKLCLKKVSCRCKSKCTFNADPEVLDSIDNAMGHLYDLNQKDLHLIAKICSKRPSTCVSGENQIKNKKAYDF